MKDRIGNELAKGDKLVVQLPEAQIFGFVADISEAGRITGVRDIGGVRQIPGRVLVSCVLALPVDPETGMVPQCVKVYDVDKHDEDVPKLGQPN